MKWGYLKLSCTHSFLKKGYVVITRQKKSLPIKNKFNWLQIVTAVFKACVSLLALKWSAVCYEYVCLSGSGDASGVNKGIFIL